MPSNRKRTVIGHASPGLLTTALLLLSGCDDFNGPPYYLEQVTTGYYHTCALLYGRVKCWGHNEYGQLGLGHTENIGNQPGDMANLPYVEFGTRESVVQVSAGGYHTCALFESGRVKCWGYAHEGPVGQGKWNDNIGDERGELAETPFIDLGTRLRVAQISAGAQHVCAIFSNRAVKCWGDNHHGQLGLGDLTNRGGLPNQMGAALPFVDLGLPAKRIRAGDGHTCAVLENDRVKCWGANSFGQLGLGDAEDRGDEPGEMGDALPFVDLGEGARVRSVVAHYEHTCAVLMDGHAKCWGDNKFGQLGLGDSVIRGFLPSDMGDNLPTVDLGQDRTVQQLDLGYGYTCFLLDDQGLKCVGYNSEGRMGYDFEGEWGGFWGWHARDMGDNLPYVDVGTDSPIGSFATGDSHTCAMIISDILKCWGYAQFGEIGSDDLVDRGRAPETMGDDLPPVRLLD
jgi:alpha-tubulin suppressor-like RCC1 family protein